MNKEELIKMTGSEEQANYAMEILLNKVKRNFVESIIKLEIKEV